MTGPLFKAVCRYVALPLAVLMAYVPAHAQVAYAELVTTEQVLADRTPTPERARVMAFMARDDVRREIQRLGVSPDEATLRVASLSDAEIQRIDRRLDELPAGGSAVGVVFGTLLVIFLVLLLTDLLGWTSVFPFTRKGALTD